MDGMCKYCRRDDEEGSVNNEIDFKAIKFMLILI